MREIEREKERKKKLKSPFLYLVPETLKKQKSAAGSSAETPVIWNTTHSNMLIKKAVTRRKNKENISIGRTRRCGEKEKRVKIRSKS